MRGVRSENRVRERKADDKATVRMWVVEIFLGGVVLSFAFHWEICKKERERSLKALNWRGSGALWRDQK